MVDMKGNRFDSNMLIGGQIWTIDKSININRIKNLINILGKSSNKNSNSTQLFILAHTTAIRNEAIRYNYRRINVRRGPCNNNTDDIEKAFLTIDKAFQTETNEVKELMSIVEILWKSASTNMAFNLRRSESSQDDVSIEILIEAIERIAKDEGICKMMKDILAEGKLLPKYPVILENFHFDEFELTSTEGNTIYYNVYSICSHNTLDEIVQPCENCILNSMKQRNHMMNMVKRMYCE